jgi:hypothetical protein
MRGTLATAALLALLQSQSAGATGMETIRDPLAAARATALARVMAATPQSDASTCVFQSINCGSTISGSLDSGDCLLSDGSVADFFQFTGAVGESVSATLSSSAFPPFLDLLDPTPSNRVFDGEPAVAHVQFTLDTAGTWTLGVTNFNNFLQLGSYTLSLACSSSNSNCTPDDTTLCLSNGRFKVKATFDAGGGNSGNAHAVGLTSDTGYLWFFQASNVEAVIKVINGCGLNSNFWVFAGGLTNVNVVIKVTDTKNQTVMTYTNPANTTFKPIQDTSAFATCP